MKKTLTWIRKAKWAFMLAAGLLWPGRVEMPTAPPAPQKQDAFGALSGLAGGNRYAAGLDSLGHALNARLFAAGRAEYVRVINPRAVDVGLGLGLSLEQTLARLVPGDTAAVKNIAAYMRDDADNGYGDGAYVCQPNVTPASGGRLVLTPYDPAAMDKRMSGLSRAEDAEFFTRHEGWHCLDDFIPKDNRHLREVFADVAAAGDMIRRGAPISMIDGVIRGRMADMEDALHLSILALEELKGFAPTVKGMDDATALHFYRGIARRGAMDSVEIERYMDYLYMDDDARAQKLKQTRRDPAYDKIRRLAPYIVKADEMNAEEAQESHADADRAAMTAFNAAALLTSGGAGPAAAVVRYGAVQDSLAARMAQDPARESLYAAQMLRVKAVFIKNLKSF